MDDKFSLIDLESCKEVIIKFFDMIEKSVGWCLTPRGKRLDFNEAIEDYKKRLMADENMSDLQRAAKIAEARRNLKEYINQGKIITYAISELKDDAEPYDTDEDWLAYFFEYAKNISNSEMQRIWGKLLASKVNGTHNITKRLLNIFSLIEQQDIEIFCKLCSMTLEHFEDCQRMYPFIYIKNYPAYYNSHGIRRYHLAQLDNLGLIEYDTHGNFVLPSRVPVLHYNNYMIELEARHRVIIGNIRFTEIGRVLYNMTQVPILDNFLENCMKIWDKMEIGYKVTEV